MINYLKELKEKGYEITMHGYNHCRNQYYCPKYEEVFFNILDGKIELEKIFNEKMVTYLPPGNSWTTEQYENVKDLGFSVIANCTIFRVLISIMKKIYNLKPKIVSTVKKSQANRDSK